MRSEQKMIELIKKLKARNNESYKFFEDLLIELRNNDVSSEGRQRLLTCYSITQYASLTHEEETLLTNVIAYNLE